eukprot:TRINITY_DN4459_c0_g1_i1.p2 TRINITY_DN4459_c0_g1~~TRINITY_DN4459_c0_g1_i1.p2  ORF type:complete len:86 (-),score=5.40 TRINITY_DN4459_c0_g1_i1:5-262(-)
MFVCLLVGCLMMKFRKEAEIAMAVHYCAALQDESSTKPTNPNNTKPDGFTFEIFEVRYLVGYHKVKMGINFDFNFNMKTLPCTLR